MDTFKLSWGLLEKNNRKKFVLIIFLFIVLSFLEVLGIASVIPFITAIFNPEILNSYQFLNKYSEILEKKNDLILPFFSIIFFFIFQIKNIFHVITYKFIYSFITNFRAVITTRVLKKYFHQEFLFFTKNPQGKLMTSLYTETKTFTDTFIDALMIFISELIILIAIFVLIIAAGKGEGILIILPIIFCVSLILKVLNKKIKLLANQRVITSEILATLAQRIFISVRDIFFSNNSKKLIDKFYDTNKDQSEVDVNVQTFRLIPRALLEVTGLLVLLSLILYFDYIGVSKDVILINLTFYFVVAFRAIPSFNKILIQYQRIKFSKNSVKIISDIINLEEKRIISLQSENQINFVNSIRLKDIDFSYETDPKLFEDLNLELKKNEIVGLYGESGSGKSSLLNLITMLIKPTKGNLYLDDKVISSKEDIRKYQNMITFISQDTFLIEDTIKNNIIFFSDSDLDEEKLNFAIKFAKVDKFLGEFKEGLNYKVGSHSRRISSGQRQRIAIARSIYNLKDILVFDEATNALDQENENLIIENLYKLKNVTVILVSHNLKLLKSCHKIYNLSDGKLVLKDALNG